MVALASCCRPIAASRLRWRGAVGTAGPKMQSRPQSCAIEGATHPWVDPGDTLCGGPSLSSTEPRNYETREERENCDRQDAGRSGRWLTGGGVWDVVPSARWNRDFRALRAQNPRSFDASRLDLRATQNSLPDQGRLEPRPIVAMHVSSMSPAASVWYRTKARKTRTATSNAAAAVSTRNQRAELQKTFLTERSLPNSPLLAIETSQ